MLSADDRLEILDTLTRYFFAMDELHSSAKAPEVHVYLEATARLCVDDLVWELREAGSSEPLLRLSSREQVAQLFAMSPPSEERVRHHLGGVAFSSTTPDAVRTRARLLVSAQRRDGLEPHLRNCAECEVLWRKDVAGWRIASYTILRDPMAPSVGG